VESNKLWKLAGKPRQGPIFQKRQDCRMQYRKRIRDGQKASDVAYTNDLHEALLRKDGPTFWKCWRSKFESVNKCNEINGCVDGDKLLIRSVSISASHTAVMMRLALLP